MLRLWCQFLVAATLCLGTVQGAFAAPPTAEAEESARKTYQAGAQAYAEGRFKDAIDLFLEAARIAPNAAFSYNIGLAYEQLGDPDNALRWYRDYLRELPNAPDRAEIEPRILDAERRLRERGVQQVTILSKPEGATVAVDGKPLGVTPWTGELAPGRHKLTLMLREYADADQTFELPSDHAVDVSLSLSQMKKRDAPQAKEAAADTGVAPEAESAGVRPLTWIALGLGATSLGAALGFELARSGAVESAREAPTNLAGKDEYDRAKSLETSARIAVGIGAAFAVAGGVLLYLDLTSDPSGGTRTTGAVGCTPGSCGLTVTTRY
jgi:tetratricopeptide (TPR) repeat protein